MDSETKQRFDTLEDAMVRLADGQTKLSEGLQQTNAMVLKLSEGQQQTNAMVLKLSEGQQRTSATLLALSEGLQQTNAAVRELATEMRALAEAQKRTEEGAHFVEASEHLLGEPAHALNHRPPRIGWTSSNARSHQRGGLGARGAACPESLSPNLDPSSGQHTTPEEPRPQASALASSSHDDDSFLLGVIGHA